MNTRTGQPTGRTKPNIPSDPNYIAPATDTDACPIPGDPVFPMYDVIVIIPTGYTANIQLLYGTSHIDRDTAGTWNIVDRTYDSVIFQVTVVPSPSYVVKITYNSGLTKQTAITGINNTFIPGPFTAITKLEIIDTTGDYNSDYSDDFFD